MSKALITDNIATLQQAQRLLLLVAREKLDFGNRIGPHLRHVLDHYDSFLRGLPGSRIDYDQRERDPGCEQSINRAQSRIENVIQGLSALNSEELPAWIEVQLATDERQGGEATTSSPARELQFLQSHAVHHYALIRLLLEMQAVSVAEDFGKAPSTIAYERARA